MSIVGPYYTQPGTGMWMTTGDGDDQWAEYQVGAGGGAGGGDGVYMLPSPASAPQLKVEIQFGQKRAIALAGVPTDKP